MDHPSIVQTEDGLNLALRHWRPPGEARAVMMLIHGLGEHGGRYDHLARFLNQAGIGVTALDLRGHGKSPGPRGHCPAYRFLLSDLDRFIRQTASLSGQLPLFLYGHSMGGGLVLNYCLKTEKLPVKGVVVTGPLLQTAFDPPRGKLLLAKIIYRLWPSLTLPSELDATAISRDPRVVEAYLHDPLVHNRLSVRLAVEMLAAGSWSLAHAAEFPLPLLIMHGEEDRLTSPQASREFAQKAGPGCTLKTWPGLFHEIHNEPEQNEVFSFLYNWFENFI